jgi:hypothetical protein
LAHHGRAAFDHGGDVRRANREPYTLSHVTTFIAAAGPGITAAVRPATRTSAQR